MKTLEKNLECKACGNKFRSETDLKEHGKLHIAKDQSNREKSSHIDSCGCGCN